MKTKLVIFGLTGDLAQRKLLPALEAIIATGEYDDLSIIGVSRREVTAAEVVGSHQSLVDRTQMFTMNLAEPGEYRELSDFLSLGTDEQALMYLSVPPSAAADIVDFLGQAGLNTPNVKILFEKPFGFDYESAKDFIERTARYYQEEQLYRIDHYMAKEIAQMLIKAHAEQHWSNKTVESIEVTATETIGIEGRAFFYEETGALRDFLQGHLLQLLALVLAEESDASLPLRRLKALEQLQPADSTQAHRAQYKGYQQEVDNEGSLTETFAALTLMSTDPNWHGVTMKLLTGKAMDKKRSYVRIIFTDGTEQVYEEGAATNADGRRLDAYERVLIEAIKSNDELFITSPEVLRSWQLVADVQNHWSLDNEPLPVYEQGAQIADVLTLTAAEA